MTTRARMKSRVSKNKKRGWKKVDIADVEDAIEEERIQERTGLVCIWYFLINLAVFSL